MVESLEHSDAAAGEPWTIAAAMLPFSNQQDAAPEVWASALAQVARAGFRFVDPTDSWLRVADLEPSRLQEFQHVVAEAGLVVPAISTARRSVIDPRDGDDNLAYSHRVIDTAVAIGARHVSFSLMRPLTEEQRRVTWFWTVPGAADPADRSLWDLAVARFRELGRHAESVGIELSLEMYEDTYLGTAADAVQLVEDIGSPAVGLNPDLGNLVRRQGPIEHWLDLIRATAPYTRYWHVKNILRLEDPGSGLVLTAPAPLPSGVIDYRTAVGVVLDAGFTGAFCVENYGGDGLAVSAANRDYLLSVLPARGTHASEEER
jgi:sugar phosphate isomerase/epimerase